jgi:hypothetical protein
LCRALVGVQFSGVPAFLLANHLFDLTPWNPDTGLFLGNWGLATLAFPALDLCVTAPLVAFGRMASSDARWLLILSCFLDALLFMAMFSTI